MAQILLLEPDAILAEQYSAALRSAGHKVVLCHDAQEAIVSADEARPDLVILEVALARHSGIEFLYEFRSYSEWQSIPVIILSRIPEHELHLDDTAGEKLAISRVLYKPDVSLTKLVQTVGRMVG